MEVKVRNLIGQSCKLGTQPSFVNIDGRCKRPIAVGQRIRVRELYRGEWSKNWSWVRVTKINPDGYFFADR